MKPEVNSDDTEHKCSPLLTFFTAVYVYMYTNTLKLNGGYFHEWVLFSSKSMTLGWRRDGGDRRAGCT